jgi:hypothetical protein
MDRLIIAAGMLVLAALFAVIRWWGLRTGVMPTRSPVPLYRDKYPRIFQAANWMYGGLAVLFVIAAIFALVGPAPATYR